MPKLSIEELHEKAETLITEARSKLDSIDDGMPKDKVNSITEEHDALMSQYDETRSRIDREQRLADEERRREADEEARRREVPMNGNPADANKPDADRRDDNPTEDERRNRSHLLVQKYRHGQKLSDQEEIECRRKWPEERAFWMYIQHGLNALPEEVRSRLIFTPEETRAITAFTGGGKVGTDADGGYLAPEEFQMEMIRDMLDYAGMLEAGVCRVIHTGHGRELTFTTADDTSNKGAPIAEATLAANTKLTWKETKMGANKYTTKVFPITNELLQDSVFDVESEVRMACAERMGRALEEHFVVGSGASGQIAGLITVLKALSGATKIRSLELDHSSYVNTALFDHLIDLEHNIDRAERRNVRFMCHDDFIKVARKVKDGDGNYLWQRGNTEMGIQPTLNHLPYFTNAYMQAGSKAATAATDPFPTAGMIPILAGNFQNYIIRFARGLSVRRLDELGALSDQTLFVGFGRYEGKVMNTKGFTYSKVKV